MFAPGHPGSNHEIKPLQTPQLMHQTLYFFGMVAIHHWPHFGQFPVIVFQPADAPSWNICSTASGRSSVIVFRPLQRQTSFF